MGWIISPDDVDKRHGVAGLDHHCATPDVRPTAWYVGVVWRCDTCGVLWSLRWTTAGDLTGTSEARWQLATWWQCWRYRGRG